MISDPNLQASTLCPHAILCIISDTSSYGLFTLLVFAFLAKPTSKGRVYVGFNFAYPKQAMRKICTNIHDLPGNF
jgi:hypothetical protein